MNIPKEILELARQGGWDVTDGYDYFEAIALDKDFWQALGKALGWDKLPDGRDWEASKFGYMEVWRHYALQFYDLILTGGNTDQFFTDLLK